MNSTHISKLCHIDIFTKFKHAIFDQPKTFEFLWHESLQNKAGVTQKKESHQMPQAPCQRSDKIADVLLHNMTKKKKKRKRAI